MTAVDALMARVRATAKGDWMHDFTLDDARDVVWPDNVRYRAGVLRSVFASLFVDRSVAILDEVSGVYPALVARAGAREVVACNPSPEACTVMNELWTFMGVRATALNARLLAFHDGTPYVDLERSELAEFLLVVNQIWPMFGAAGGDFDAIAEAFAFFATEGVVLDWNDAGWAKPPPPPEYNRPALCAALAKKFEYVTTYSDWLVVALGRRPTAAAESAA